MFHHNKKETKFEYKVNMDEPCKHYVKWNKPDTREQIVYLREAPRGVKIHKGRK